MEFVGQQVGNYDLVEHLGRGGYADVYRGIYRRFQVEVAVKMLRVQEFSAAQEQEFRKEAQIITALRHPHIIRVLNYDVWQEPEGLQRRIPYIVMTYAPLGSLRKAYPEGQRITSATEIALYITQMAAALQEAHNQSVVHCDVKPENMLRISADDLVLTDFGIAKDQHSTVEVPQLPNSRPEAPRVFGTPGYMPPERCLGGPVSRSGDQYALAIVAYEWLTGHRPFEGHTSIEILTKQATLTPPSMRARFPDISEEVEDVVMRALAKEHTDRYPTIQEFADAFAQAMSSSQPPVAQARRPQGNPAGPAQAPQARAGQVNPAAGPAQAPQARAGQVNPAVGPVQAPQARAGQVNPAVGPAQAPQAQGPMVLSGNASGYTTHTMGQTQPSQPPSYRQQSTSSGFEDFKALWSFHPVRTWKRWLRSVEWLRTDPPARFSQRPRTMFPLLSQFWLLLVTAMLAILTLPSGLIAGVILEVFFSRFLRWALYLVRPGAANFFLGLVSLYYAIGFILLSVYLFHLFSYSPVIQTILVALPIIVFLISVSQNRHYVKRMHRQ